ncbi:MAG: hypothetical protein ACPGVP_06685 [Thiolinea sp.]
MEAIRSIKAAHYGVTTSKPEPFRQRIGEKVLCTQILREQYFPPNPVRCQKRAAGSLVWLVFLVCWLSACSEPVKPDPKAELFGITSASEQQSKPVSGADAIVRDQSVDDADNTKSVINTGVAERSDIAKRKLPAFPGAEGDGAASRGGRGGKVLIVDRLDDPCPTKACTTEDLADPAKTTPGTLRWALLQNYPRTVVFQVSGLIKLQEDHVEQVDGQLHTKRLAAIRIQNPYLTVAGQTAPAGGITIINNGISVRTHDVVLRYLRFRTGRGSRTVFPNQQNPQTLMIENGAERVMVDHCSFSWMPAEGVSIFTGEVWDGSKGTAKDITLSWNIIGEGLVRHKDRRGHPNAAFMSGFEGDEKYAARNITLHHNLIVHTQKRNGDVLTHNARLLNNLIYNWEWLPTVLAGGVEADVIGNIWKPGPVTQTNSANNTGIHLVPAAADLKGKDAGNWWHAVQGEPSLYLKDNAFADVNKVYSSAREHKKLLCYYRQRDTGCQNNQIRDSWLRDKPMQKKPVYPVTIQKIAEAESSVLNNAGVNKRINHLGVWVNNRDMTDERYVEEYQQGKYIRNSFPWHQDDVGGYAVPIEGAPPLDNDKDGMADVWEVANGLNPSDASDALQIPLKGKGYTWLEIFINGMAEPVE